MLGSCTVNTSYFDINYALRLLRDGATVAIENIEIARVVEGELHQLRAAKPAADTSTRRELAEKILLKLIEIAPTSIYETAGVDELLPAAVGAKMAWEIADAFLKAEGSRS
jgi:hypothetical protein